MFSECALCPKCEVSRKTVYWEPREVIKVIRASCEVPLNTDRSQQIFYIHTHIHTYICTYVPIFLTLIKMSGPIIPMHTALHVKYPLFSLDFNQTRIFATDFRNILKYQTSWKPVQWEPSCSMRTDRRTDMAKLIVAFPNFANAPKNSSTV